VTLPIRGRKKGGAVLCKVVMGTETFPAVSITKGFAPVPDTHLKAVNPSIILQLRVSFVRHRCESEKQQGIYAVNSFRLRPGLLFVGIFVLIVFSISLLRDPRPVRNPQTLPGANQSHMPRG
jgi:uncharacterized membrane protein (DUF4010 family)